MIGPWPDSVSEGNSACKRAGQGREKEMVRQLFGSSAGKEDEEMDGCRPPLMIFKGSVLQNVPGSRSQSDWMPIS